MIFISLLLTVFFRTQSALLVTVPKSGTHLLFKSIQAITGIPISCESGMKSSLGDSNLWTINEEDLRDCLIKYKNNYLHSHMCFSSERQQCLLNVKHKIILNIRDPRDQAVSHAHWIKDLPQYYPDAINKNFNEVLSEVIINIANFYSYFLPWSNYPYALIVRYEDLVGSHGGGNDSLQIATVKAIAKHFLIELSEGRAQEIATSLYGRSTFREGKIGSWKHEFTPEQKELFKIYGGQLLIDLGYEKDLNW
jgi:hypothetical protein